jgi:type IV secretion system protein VirB5
VQVTSVVRASDSSFQVKWTETAYERGSQDGTSHWTGILTLVTRVPTSADVLRRNPLGIYVDAIDWSRELEPAAASGAKPASAPSPAVPVMQPSTVSTAIQPTLSPETRP